MACLAAPPEVRLTWSAVAVPSSIMSRTGWSASGRRQSECRILAFLFFIECCERVLAKPVGVVASGMTWSVMLLTFADLFPIVLNSYGISPSMYSDGCVHLVCRPVQEGRYIVNLLDPDGSDHLQGSRSACRCRCVWLTEPRLLGVLAKDMPRDHQLALRAHEHWGQPCLRTARLSHR